MDTRRPHQNSSVPKEEPMQGFCKDTTSKCPLLFWTPTKKPCSQPAKKDDEERHTFTARANLKAKENLLVARINGAPVHNSICSTPIKTPFGTPSQLQAPTSKPSFLSANKSKQSVGAGGYGVHEDASITRTPFRLLAGKDLNACLFSPSQTPQPLAFPAPLDKLASPSLEGHAKRVLVMPQELSPARRVPVKQKGSRQTPAGKQSSFATPKSSRVNSGFQFVTPKPGRADYVSRASGQNGDGDAAEYHVMRNVDVNNDKKNLERSARLKRVIASTPQQSPFVTPRSSSRVEHLLKTDGQNFAFSGGKSMPLDNPDVKHGRAEVDGSESLIRALASMPQLSSPARRVPLRQKQKTPVEKPPPPCHKEKQQSNSRKALPENPETCKSSQRRKQTCQNEAGVLDGKRQSATNQVPDKVVEGKGGGNGTDKTKQLFVDNHSIRGDRSKLKGKGGTGTDKTLQQSVDKHAIKGISSKPKGKGGSHTGKTRQQSVDNHANKSGRSKPKGKDGNVTDKTKQQSVDKHATKSGSSKPKGKGGNGIDKTKQQSVDKHAIKGISSKSNRKGGSGTDNSKQQSADNHAIEGGSSKQHNEDISKTCGDDSVDDKGINVNRDCEDGKQHKACDNDVGHDEYHDVGIDATQLCGDDGTNHQADNFGDNDRCQSDKCMDDEKQHRDSPVEVSGDDDFMEHYGDGSEHNGNDNGIEKHDHHDGNDELKKNDADAEKQHDDDDREKWHDHANVVKKQQHDP